MSEQPKKKSEIKQKNTRLRISGPSCGGCTSKLKEKLQNLPGYQAKHYEFSLSLPQNRQCDLTLSWLDDSAKQSDLDAIIEIIKKSGFDTALPTSDSIFYRLYLPHNMAMSAQLQQYLKEHKSNFPSFEILPEQDSHSFGIRTTDPTALIRTLWQDSRWKQVKLGLWRAKESFQPPKVTIYFVRALVNLALSVPLMIWGMIGGIGFVSSLALGFLTLGLMIWSGGDFYKDAWQQLKRKQTNMNTLFSIGTISAWIASMIMTLFPGFLGAMTLHVHFCAVMMITAVVNLGRGLKEWLIHRAKEQVSPDVRSPSQRFAQLQPLWVEKKVGDRFEQVIVTQIMPGDVVRVFPGNRIPVDGHISLGGGYVETDHHGQAFGKYVSTEAAQAQISAGESLKLIYQDTPPWVEITATKRGDEGHLFQFYDTLESCGQTERGHVLIDKLSRWFVPGVLGFAALSMAVWALVPGITIGFVISIGLAVLLCACPCSFALAAPISQAIAAKKLMDANLVVPNVEDISQLELRSGDFLILDKTGTLTEASPTVDEDNLDQTLTPQDKLAIAALENGIAHWAAASLCQQWSSPSISQITVMDKMIAPNGLSGRIDGKLYVVGSEKFLQNQNIVLPTHLDAWKKAQAEQGKSYVFVAIDGRYQAAIPLQSKILDEETKTCIAEYQQQGVRVLLLTGDDKNSANWCAAQVGIQNIEANVMPDQTPDSKKTCIERFQRENPNARVVMIGDGRNDAAALKQAGEQGIGIGVGEGPDCRLAANILLPDGKLPRLKQLVRIYRLLQSNILSNLKIAIVYNTASLILAAGILFPIGYMLSPLMAAIAMGLSSVIVIANAMRLNEQIDRAQGVKSSHPALKRPGMRLAAVSCCVAALSFMCAMGCAVICGMPLAMAFSTMAFSSGIMCVCCVASLIGYAALAVLAISLLVQGIQRLWQDQQVIQTEHAKRYQQLYDAATFSEEDISNALPNKSTSTIEHQLDSKTGNIQSQTTNSLEASSCLLKTTM
jgi:Cu+-exporting ATPase